MKKKINKIITSIITFFVLLYNKAYGNYMYMVQPEYGVTIDPELQGFKKIMLLLLFIPIILMIGLIKSYKKRKIEKNKRIFYTIINVLVIIISLILIYCVKSTMY